MQITFNTSEALSDLDKAVLALLLGDAPAAKAPAAKKTAAKKTAASEPTDLTDEATDQAGDESADEPDEEVRAAALARASELLASGDEGKARVLAALKTAGAPKVSAIEGPKVASFLAALTD